MSLNPGKPYPQGMFMREGGDMKRNRMLNGAITVLVLFFLWGAPGESARAAQGTFSRDELSQMLAPIALYPDELLSQVLMASTYPLEVVEADRWAKKNPLLSGDALDDALSGKDWDASVKALCHVPTLLALMSEHLEETTKMGNAFQDQQAEVMAVIQDLRHRAYREGNLRSDAKLRVLVRSDDTIVIEPVKPETVYIPYYNTRTVYGTWWCPGYSPWYWGPPGVAVGSGIQFWPDFYVGFGLGFGYWSYFDWPGRSIIIHAHHPPRFIRHHMDWNAHEGRWHHDIHHRRRIEFRNRVHTGHVEHEPQRGPAFHHRELRELREHRELRELRELREHRELRELREHSTPETRPGDRSSHEGHHGSTAVHRPEPAAPAEVAPPVEKSPWPMRRWQGRDQDRFRHESRSDTPFKTHRPIGPDRFSYGSEHRGPSDSPGHHEGW
jgi:hypothetical protein